jgi:hypothetical protein
MAWRFRQYLVQSGDILDPFHWNLNHNEFMSEFNGYLDRDNFRQKIFTRDEMVDNCCNEEDTFVAGAVDNYQPDLGTTGWQNTNRSVDFRTETECQVIVEYSGYHSWSDEYLNDFVCCRYQLTVDGATISRGNWQSGSRVSDVIYLVGVLPLSPGPHEVMVQIQAGQIGRTSIQPERVERIGTEDDIELTLSRGELIVHRRYR